MGIVNSIAVHENMNVAEHAAMFGINPVIMGIIHSRGYRTAGAIEGFLHGTLADMHSPFLFEGMEQAVRRIRRAVDVREKIGIFADSDLDGITSLAVIHNLFSRMKIEPFLRYLKDDENYGITRGIIDEFRGNGVTLIITVDSGTRDVAEIAYARSLGIDVIVTDHHEQDRELPDAILINPKLAGTSYPFKNLAGVGVAFKLCHAILMSYLPSFNKLFLVIAGTGSIYAASYIRDCAVEKISRGLDAGGLSSLADDLGPDDFMLVHDGTAAAQLKAEHPGKRIHDFADFIAGVTGRSAQIIDDMQRTIAVQRKLHPDEMDILIKIFLETHLAGSEKVCDYIESVMGLVAIGSIADVISLTGENRILVRAGLENLGKTKHRALSMIMNGERIDSRYIGWTVAPLLNTPGRLGKTDLTVNFFTVNDGRRLSEIIAEIKELNDERRIFVKEFCEKMLDDICRKEESPAGRLIHIKTDGIPEGYAGLIANRIADATGKPVIVTVFPGKNGIVKGSGRSRGGMPFFSHFGNYSELFERIGGHENAFGFTVRADRVDEIIALVERALVGVASNNNEIEIDCELDIACITAGFVNELQMLEPYGNGNREPFFMTRNMTFESFQHFGSNHGKYLISVYNPLVAIGWGMGAEMKDLFETGKPIDIVYRLENNHFNGRVTPRMILVDMHIAGQ